MKSITTHLTTLTIGLIFGWTVSSYLSSSIELTSSYIDEAFKAKQNISVLEKLDDGKIEEATSYLTQSLAASKLYLENCSIDACKSRSIPHIDSTIAHINETTQ